MVLNFSVLFGPPNRKHASFSQFAIVCCEHKKRDVDYIKENISIGISNNVFFLVFDSFESRKVNLYFKMQID